MSYREKKAIKKIQSAVQNHLERKSDFERVEEKPESTIPTENVVFKNIPLGIYLEPEGDNNP